MSWTRRLKRVFDIDIEHCPNCGGSLKIIAAIEDPPVIVKILSHLGLPNRARRARRRNDSIYSKRPEEPENRLPTLTDGASRSEFERAARSGTLRAPLTTPPPKSAEATEKEVKLVDGNPIAVRS